FRIERGCQGTPAEPSGVSEGLAQARHEEIMGALAGIRDQMPPQDSISQQIVETCQHDLREAQKIKGELQQIHDAILQTKQEIATLHRGEYKGIEVARMTDELGAIVQGTEQATESILHAAECIDNNAGDLAASLNDDSQQAMTSDIQDQVIKIFEACNFQDLTGQRTSKVVSAFKFIEQRVLRMMEIWGGLESFEGLELEDTSNRNGHAELLNGPALKDDEGIASQDDIDSLFD
ncbi:MAG: protein phosphatase CheZ, partial [Methyloligellaceae bacterium]